MEIKTIIDALQECLDDGKTRITLLTNLTNGEDEDFDIEMTAVEVWNDGDETATLFMCKN
jgi:hypothetical protein